MFLAENKIGNVGMALGLPNFISGLSMFFLTMFAPLHNYSFLGSKILFLMIAWMCNASLLLANYGEKNLFLFLGCNFFFFFCFLSKIRLEMLVCTGLYPILSLVCVCFFLQCLQHYIITFFYG